MGQPYIVLKAAGGEDRLCDLGYEAPDAVRTREQVHQLGALAADESSQADLREVGSFGDSDIGVGGDQRLLGGANIRAPFEQRRGQAGRHIGQNVRCIGAMLSFNISRVFSEQA